MNRITVVRMIHAPVDIVFETIADIEQFSQAKEVSTELEVTECIHNQRVRMVADSHGTVWDSVYTVQQEKEHTKPTLVMDANAYQ
jgi:hypothetical protein